MFAPGLDDLRKNWKPPAELNRATPRPVKLTGGGMGAIALAVFFALAGIAAYIGLRMEGQREQAELDLLVSQGQTVSATVDRVWTTSAKSRSFIAAYSFEVDGREYDGDHALARAHWLPLRPGSPIEVRYLPSNPALNFPVSDPLVPVSSGLAIFFAGLLAAFSPLCWYPLHKQRSLLQDGQAAPAIVIKNRKEKTNVLYYDFPTLDGARVSSYVNHTYIEKGAILCVLYDPRRPGRNVLYPCSLVETSSF